MRPHFNPIGFVSSLRSQPAFIFSMTGIGMSIFVVILSLILFFISPLSSNSLLAESSRSAETKSELKKVGDYRKDLKAFIKKSKSSADDIRFGAVLNLCLLHKQLVSDPRYESNSQLQGFRAVAADRLKKCKKEIELQLLRYKRKHGIDPRDRPSKGLSQLSPESTEYTFEKYQYSLAVDMQAMTSLSGGPINLWKYTGNPAGPLCDYGPDLVNLIVNTINPDFWRRNGGTGIIEYYQPLRIIVVGASAQVHNEIGDLLNTFRRNSR